MIMMGKSIRQIWVKTSLDSSSGHCSDAFKGNFRGNTSINPYLMNGFSHHYHLGQSTFIFRGIRSDFSISFNFSI